MKNQYFHRLAALALALSACALTAFGHGDEPHGDEPHAAASVAPGAPRFEAATEAFEMVGRLENGALTLFINQFETNEPVLKAKVELESGEQKAVATYQAQQGSYVVRDPKFVALLSAPGAHPLVVTLTAGDEADLLEATLETSEPATEEHEQRSTLVGVLATTLGLGVVGAGVWMARQRRLHRRAQA